jgi:hypothetical protein
MTKRETKEYQVCPDPMSVLLLTLLGTVTRGVCDEVGLIRVIKLSSAESYYHDEHTYYIHFVL